MSDITLNEYRLDKEEGTWLLDTSDKANGDDRRRGASVYSTWFNATNVTVGAGTLGLPFALSLCGLGLGIAITCCVAMLALYSAQLLLMATHASGKTSYQGLCEAAFGPRWAKALDILVLIQCFSVLVAYMIIIGDLVAVPTGVLTAWVTTPEPWWAGREFIIGISVVVLVLPVSLLPKFDFLRHTSLVALACMLYLACVVIAVAVRTDFDDINYTDGRLRDDYEKKVVWARLSPDLLFALPMITFAFASHLQIPIIYAELRERTVGGMMRVMLAAVSACCALYLTVGIFGYLTFYQTVAGNVFNSYRDKSDPMILVAKIGVGVTLVFSAPLFVYPMRANFIHLVFPQRMQQFHWVRHVLITLGILGLSLTIAVFLKKIEVVFAFSGSTVVAMMMFVLPGSFFVRICATAPRHHKVGAYSTIVFGIVMGSMGTIVTILDASDVLHRNPLG